MDCCSLANTCIISYGASLGACLLAVASILKARAVEKKLHESTRKKK